MHSENIQFFYELLARALWNADKPVDPEDFPPPPTEGDWPEVLEYASAHSVAGLFGQALSLLPEAWQPKQEGPSSVEKIISDDDSSYRRHAEALISLHAALRSCGLRPVFFKSTVWASYYPHPEHLRIHDLAFFIAPAQQSAALRCMAEKGAKPATPHVTWEKRYLYHGLHCQLFFKTHVFSCSYSRRYYRELEAHAMQPSQLCKFNLEGQWLPMFPPLFSIVCQTAYLQRQLLLGRITLRQICDWTMLLYSERTSLGIAENQLLRHLRKLDLQRLYDALGNLARRHLGLPNSSYAAVHANAKGIALGERLYQSVQGIPLAGDVSDPACLPQEKWRIKVANLMRIFKRCRQLRSLCPRESLFMPWTEFNAMFFPPHIR